MPNEFFGRYFWPKIASNGAHISVQQLEPSASKGVCKLVRVFVEPLGNCTVGRIFTHGHVSGGHECSYALRCIFGVWCQIFFIGVNWVPLLRTCRAFHQLPLITKKKVEVSVVPRSGVRSPSTFKTTSDRVTALTRGMGALPAKAHIFNRSAFRFNANKFGIASTVCFPKGVAASH